MEPFSLYQICRFGLVFGTKGDDGTALDLGNIDCHALSSDFVPIRRSPPSPAGAFTISLM